MTADSRERGTTPTERLRVPSPSTPWSSEVVQFALSYDVYARHGTPGAGAIANRLRARWLESGEVDADLATLRCALFFEQRRAHHADVPPDATYLRDLLSEIHRQSGGWVDGPADSFL